VDRQESMAQQRRGVARIIRWQAVAERAIAISSAAIIAYSMNRSACTGHKRGYANSLYGMLGAMLSGIRSR